MAKIRPLLLLGLLCLGGLAQAQDTAAPAAPATGAWCEQHPDRCDALKTRLKAKCDADPAQCEQMKQKAEDKAAACRADPESCRAKLEAACKRNPQRPICKRLTAPPAAGE